MTKCMLSSTAHKRAATSNYQLINCSPHFHPCRNQRHAAIVALKNPVAMAVTLTSAHPKAIRACTMKGCKSAGSNFHQQLPKASQLATAAQRPKSKQWHHFWDMLQCNPDTLAVGIHKLRDCQPQILLAMRPQAPSPASLHVPQWITFDGPPTACHPRHLRCPTHPISRH